MPLKKKGELCCQRPFIFLKILQQSLPLFFFITFFPPCIMLIITIINTAHLLALSKTLLSNFQNTTMNNVGTRFDLNPKWEWIKAHVAQTINLQSARKKASLILGQNIRFQCKKGQDTTMEPSNKPLRTCPRDVILLFFSSRVLFPFSSVPPSSVFPRLIYHSFFAFFIIHVWTWHSTSFFRHPPHPLLNLPFLAGKLLVHCSGITSTLMRPEGQLGDI